jgi:hypothetical protein
MLDDQRHVLYTRGSVPFYGTYPGMYIPSPLPFRLVETESSPEYLADEKARKPVQTSHRAFVFVAAISRRKFSRCCT